MIVEYKDFQELKKRFAKAGLDEKISLYTTTCGLSQEQYRELLDDFPPQKLNLLDQALW